MVFEVLIISQVQWHLDYMTRSLISQQRHEGLIISLYPALLRPHLATVFHSGPLSSGKPSINWGKFSVGPRQWPGLEQLSGWDRVRDGAALAWGSCAEILSFCDTVWSLQDSELLLEPV